MSTVTSQTIRVLVADDEPSMRESYRDILRAPGRGRRPAAWRTCGPACSGLDRPAPPRPRDASTWCTAPGAEEAVRAVQGANDAGQPFAVAFLDMRMPPGPDGVWAASQIRELDPRIDIVVVTAYSDLDPEEIARRVPPQESLFYLQKPFHPHEIRQLAGALGPPAPGRGPCPPSGLLRRGHRAAQPGLLQGAADPGPRARPPPPAQAGAAVPGPGQLQAHQRYARPLLRRHPPERGRQAPAREPARERRHRPGHGDGGRRETWRGWAATSSPCCWPRSDSPPTRASGRQRLLEALAAPVSLGGSRRDGHARASGSRSTPTTGRTRRPCSRTPTWPCTSPSARAGTATSSSPRP